MNYSAAEISTILGVTIDHTSDNPLVKYISVDTRSIIRPHDTLFVALPGKYKDGHDFIQQAYDLGVRHFVTNRPISLDDACIYLIPDTLLALQDIAQWHRSSFNIPIIGITGSNGKTTVKEWLHQLLSVKLNTYKSPLSYNSQIGVPLSIFGLTGQHEVAVLEAGISQMNEMHVLSDLIRCSIGIFTTLGDAHSAGFENKLIKLKEKLKLFKYSDTIIYNEDQSDVDQAIKSELPSINRLTISLKHPDADFYIRSSDQSVLLDYDGKTISLPLTDAHDNNLKNIASVLAAIHSMGIDITDCIPAIEDIIEVPMRLQIDHGTNGAIIIDDGYNADLQSFESALNFMQLHAHDRHKKLILSEFGELKNQDKVIHRLADLIQNFNINEVYAIGSKLKSLSEILPKNVLINNYPSVLDLLSTTEILAEPNDIILIKGARSFRLEKIHRHLSAKMHRTILEIDIAAIGHNLSVHSQLLYSSTKIMAMVKASAYGSGIEEIARYLALRQVDYFGVAFTDEGVRLRKSGIQQPIMVMSPVMHELTIWLRHNIEPSINSLIDLKALLTQAISNKGLRIHINIDTGMNRMGFNDVDIAEVSNLLRNNDQLRIASIYTHLAASDSPAHRAYTLKQIDRFHTAADIIVRNLTYKPMRHVLNSNGLISYPEYQLDMIRLGIGLYGIEPTVIIKETLQPVHTFKTHISHIQDISKGEYVGYNLSWKATRPSRIATIQVGYADGLPRKSGHAGYHVWIAGQLAPIIGHVCMDLTMVDITDIGGLHIGEEVIIYGRERPIALLAKANDTIAYELLSNTSDRVKRLYIQ